MNKQRLLTTSRILLQVAFLYSLGYLLNSIELVTFKKVCLYPEHGPFFYGFPFIYRTNMTWVNSGSGIIYLSGLFLNILFWSSLSSIIYTCTTRLFQFKSSIHKFAKFFTIVLFLALFLLEHQALDIQYKMIHDDKLDYYQKEMECQKKLVLFNFQADNYSN